VRALFCQLPRFQTDSVGVGYPKAELRLVDLASFSSVKDFSSTFEGDEKGVDILVMNAGVAMAESVNTEDGFETECVRPLP
jgi:short-subunit dehydrogenase